MLEASAPDERSRQLSPRKLAHHLRQASTDDERIFVQSDGEGFSSAEESPITDRRRRPKSGSSSARRRGKGSCDELDTVTVELHSFEPRTNSRSPPVSNSCSRKNSSRNLKALYIEIKVSTSLNQLCILDQN
jgi:hypothetical protein